jgi:ATP-binding cassette, subfamily F, member 3
MIAVNLDRISFSYATDPIFSSLSWEIHDDRVVGLVGPNGCGKSTLLNLITGALSCDDGFMIVRKGLTIGYLPQDPHFPAGQTVWQIAFSASSGLGRVETELEQIEQQLTLPEIFNSPEKLAAILENQQALLAEYTRLGGPSYEGLVRSILRELNFKNEDMQLPVEALSGGQKKLVALSRLLINKPGLLVLDEPDNHLDLQGKAFLEQLIRNYEGAVLIVSHDRYLLDLVVDEIAELEDGKLSLYTGNYSEYAFEKGMHLQRQQQVYHAQQKEITRLEQAAKRLMLWGKIFDNNKFSRRGKSILNHLEKIERTERPVLDRKRMSLALTGWVGSNKVLECKEIGKVFLSNEAGKPDTIILAGVNLLVRRGERVGLVGANGAGKSLLFRLILGQDQPSQGIIDVGPSVKIGYYAQQHETLEYERTLLDTVRLAGNFSEQKAVAFLGKFLFGYRQTREKIITLSGGERSRLQMALLMLSGANFLLLDEPTNNLDIASTEVLENALDDFEGTVLTISHDRYFLDRVVDRIEVIEQGYLTGYRGNYSDYQSQQILRT